MLDGSLPGTVLVLFNLPYKPAKYLFFGCQKSIARLFTYIFISIMKPLCSNAHNHFYGKTVNSYSEFHSLKIFMFMYEMSLRQYRSR